MPNPITWARNIIKQLYAWTTKWAESKNAERALAGLSFAESSFFPIPPDPLLIAIVLNYPKRWLRTAAITTVASVLGGILGYYIGFALFESIGDWVITTYHLEDQYASLQTQFDENTTLTVFAAALTPIPYKIFTISAGAFKVNFILFVVASILGRGGRFFAVAALSSVLGKRYKEQIERYIDVISLAILAIVVILFIVTR